MKQKNLLEKLILLIMCVCAVLPVARASAESKLTITYKNNQLSIDALNVKPEQLFIELGNQCKTDVIAHGDVFPGQEVTLHFENVPIQDAIKKLVKTCGIRNYLMDFQGDTPEKTRLAKLELFVGGSGQHVLSRAAEHAAQPEPQKTGSAEPKKDRIEPIVNETIASGKLQNKSSFAQGKNVPWDGSAPLDFPEYKGDLPYDKSKFPWQDDAKTFSKKSMSIIPPAVRDTVAEPYIRACDEVAQERGASTITPDIAADALERLAKGFNMPPTVMNNLPKKTDDLNKPKIPIEPDNLKPEYR
jgi:hypothetical protein